MIGPATLNSLSPEARRFAKFLVVGGINTGFGYGVFALTFLVTGHAALAVVASTILGVCFNFVSTGKFVFNTIEPGRIVPFLLVYVGQLGLNVLLLRLLEQAGAPVLLAQIVILPVLAVASYLALRQFVFGQAAGGPP
jgi:putative flippase GtrA